MPHAVLATFAALSACGVLLAQDASPTATTLETSAPQPRGATGDTAAPGRPSEAMHLTFTADVWFPRLDGDVTFNGPTLDLGDAFELDGTEATLDGTVEGRFDIWHVTLSGFTFSTDGSTDATAPLSFGGLGVGAGERVRSEFDMSSAALELGVSVYRPLADQVWPWGDVERNESNVAYNGDYRGDLRFIPFIGARWIGLEHSVINETAGGQASFESDWAAVYGGARVELAIRFPKEFPLGKRLVVSASGGAGAVFGGGSGTVFQARAGLDLFIFENVAISGGYQLLNINADEDDYDFDGGVQGMWAGVTIWF